MVKLGWAKLKRFLAQANTWTGTQTFANAVIQAGSIAASVVVDLVSEMLSPPPIGGTTPAYGRFSPLVAKGPAIVNTGFVGTLTAAASTSVTFSSAADAILCGYSATAPVLGGTLISNGLTRYITAWTNATTAVVDTAVTWAGTSITSVQLPISFDVTSTGVFERATLANGNTYHVGTVGIGATPTSRPLTLKGPLYSLSTETDTVYDGGVGPNMVITFPGGYGALRASVAHAYFFDVYNGGGQFPALGVTQSGNILTGGITAAGTSAAKVLGVGSGTLWTTSPADMAQVGVKDYNGVAGDARFYFGGEASAAKFSSLGSGTVSVKGAPTTGGGFTRNTSEAVSAALSGASGSIAVNVPAGARILGVQLRVDTAITSGDGGTTWTAVWVNTPTTAITSGKAFTKDTNYSALHAAYELTTDVATITITPNSGTFSGGVVRAVAYYEAMDTLLAAP